jgi:hypothetical protein
MQFRNPAGPTPIEIRIAKSLRRAVSRVKLSLCGNVAICEFAEFTIGALEGEGLEVRKVCCPMAGNRIICTRMTFKDC